MSNVNIFQNGARTVPTNDEQIIRVSMEEIEIGGRKDHLPPSQRSGALTLSHTPNAGSTTGK